MRAVKLTETSNADISDIKIYILGNHFCFSPLSESNLLKGNIRNYFDDDRGLHWYSPVYNIDKIDEFVDLITDSYGLTDVGKSKKLDKYDLRANLLKIFNMNRQMCLVQILVIKHIKNLKFNILFLFISSLRMKVKMVKMIGSTKIFSRIA